MKPLKMLLTLCAFLLAYLGMYFVIMDQNTRSVDENYNISYYCSVRFKKSFPMVDSDLGVTMSFREESILNCFFYPLERIFLPNDQWARDALKKSDNLLVE
jgi:hypothetical protein